MIIRPRKRRTRQHVIADQGVHYVEGFIIDEGHVSERVRGDYGYDLYCSTFDADGFVEPGLIRIQVKATEAARSIGTDWILDIDVRDYRLWTMERMPVFLILFEAARKHACWLDVQGYFGDDDTRRPSQGAKTVRVRIPMRQRWNHSAVRMVRERKQETLHTMKGTRS